MTKKNIKKLVAGLFVILVFVGVYFGVNIYMEKQAQQEMEAAQQEAEDAIVVSVDPDQIQTITFDGDEELLLFEKKDGSWYCPDDEHFVMNDSKISLMLNDLLALTATRTLEDVEDKGQYGLGNEAKQILVTDVDGKEISLYYGIRNTSTRDLYFQTDKDSDIVYMTGTALDSHFGGTLKDYAQYESFPEAQPSAMRIFDVKKAQSEDSYVLDMPGDDNCTVADEDGNSQKANLNLVGSMQQNLSNISWAKNVEYYCEDFAEYGLEKPQAVIAVTYDEESEKDGHFTLSVGDRDENENYYVRLNDSMQVHTVRQEYLEDFVESKPTSFWSLTYSFVSIGDTETLEVISDGETYVMERIVENRGEENETVEWKVNGQDIEEKLFTDFYYACVSVTAQERLDAVPETEDVPVLDLHYYLTDGTEKTIQYYKYDQNFYTVVYEAGTNAAHTNKLYVNTMLENLERIKEALQ